LKRSKISVIGLGFVGLSLAVVNAKKRFETIGIDINKEKLKNLQSGRPSFFEPKLEGYLKSGLRSNRLTITDDLASILQTDLTFVTVGTPSNFEGKIELAQLKKVISNMSKLLKKKKTEHLVIIKSTVIPTTTSKFVLPAFENIKKTRVVVNPEFLREGNAINDLLKPHIIVIGESNKKEGDVLEKYYKQFYKKLPEILRTDIVTAEMIKYSNNAFLATKISFINSIANICQNLSKVDVNKIAYAIGKDSRIGPQFLNAGPGFGGSCLPKDLTALIGFTNKFGNVNQFFKAVRIVNETQPLQIIKLLKSMNLLKPKITVSVLGLAFKKNTDDIRDAVSIKLVKRLLKNGLIIRVHDPMAVDNFKKVFRNKISYHNRITDCLNSSDCCIILTEWEQYKKLEPTVFTKNMKNPAIIDARRILNPIKFSKLNFRAIGLGM